MVFKIRRATSADLAAIALVHNDAGVQSTGSADIEPVTVEERAAWFKNLAAKDHPVLVLVEDGLVVGYANYGAFIDKPAFQHTVEHAVFILEQHRHSGGGRMLMGALIDHARGHGVRTMLGVVDASDEAGIEFHKRMGFEVVGRLPSVGRKFDRWLDLVIVAMTFGGGT